MITWTRRPGHRPVIVKVLGVVAVALIGATLTRGGASAFDCAALRRQEVTAFALALHS